MVDRDLTRLTRGETLWAWRLQNGLTQARAGKRLGISRHRVSAIETGLPGGRILATLLRNFTPTLGTMLALARRRYGLGLLRTAEAIGVSAVTLLAWERRADPRLLTFWARRGFTFAPKRE